MFLLNSITWYKKSWNKVITKLLLKIIIKKTLFLFLKLHIFVVAATKNNKWWFFKFFLKVWYQGFQINYIALLYHKNSLMYVKKLTKKSFFFIILSPPHENFWAAGYPPETLYGVENLFFDAIRIWCNIYEVYGTLETISVRPWKSRNHEKRGVLSPPP